MLMNFNQKRAKLLFLNLVFNKQHCWTLRIIKVHQNFETILKKDSYAPLFYVIIVTITRHLYLPEMRVYLCLKIAKYVCM